jgi:hypothetical protein
VNFEFWFLVCVLEMSSEQEVALYIAQLVNLAKEHKADTVVSTVRKLAPAERLLFFRSIGTCHTTDTRHTISLSLSLSHTLSL